MRSNKIKLADLIPLREAEKKDKAEKNPFAGSEDAGEDTSKEEAPADDTEDKDAPKEKEAPKSEESTKPKVKFSIGAVKRYNNAEFLGTEGEIISADKNGMVVNVLPDNVQIIVNYKDIL